ncbi:MAG: hypothetical protein HRU20_30410 [Pseudomonadales bacterium]|nr:hypothetical protein [Pseudomonadales bacterium]
MQRSNNYRLNGFFMRNLIVTAILSLLFLSACGSGESGNEDELVNQNENFPFVVFEQEGVTVTSISTYKNTPITNLRIVIDDAEIENSQLQFTITSNDQTLLPDENILIEGDGNVRSVTITPALDQVGQLTLAGMMVGISSNKSFSKTLQLTVLEPVIECINCDGKVTTVTHSAVNGQQYAAVQQDDGKLVVAGNGFNGSNFDFTLIRYNSNGSLDTSFGLNGVVSTDINADDDIAQSIILQSDGKLVAAGYTYTAQGPTEFALIRYNSDGTLDKNFGSNGIVTTKVGIYGSIGRSLIQQNDGKFVLAGICNDGFSDFSMVRYLNDGSVDVAFGVKGIVKTDLAKSDAVRSIIQQQDGKLVLVGEANVTAYTDPVIIRYNTDGSLDNSFGVDGVVVSGFGEANESFRAVVQQSDGQLVAAGVATVSGSQFSHIGLSRFNLDGSLDTSFAGDGKLTTAATAQHNGALSLIQQFDGKLLAAGYGMDGSTSMMLARYDSSGSLDAAFVGDVGSAGNFNGTVLTEIENGPSLIHSLLQQADGKLVAVGASNNGSDRDISIVRYNLDGTLDVDNFGPE